MAVPGSQKRRGFTDVLYNIKHHKFYAPLPGDNYYELDVEIGGEGPGGSAETNNVVLSNVNTDPVRSKSIIPEPEGLRTQADFNQWNYNALTYLETAIESIEIPEAPDLSAYALKTEVPDAYTKAESDAKYLAVDISSLSELPTV